MLFIKQVFLPLILGFGLVFLPGLAHANTVFSDSNVEVQKVLGVGADVNLWPPGVGADVEVGGYGMGANIGGYNEPYAYYPNGNRYDYPYHRHHRGCYWSYSLGTWIYTCP